MKARKLLATAMITVALFGTSVAMSPTASAASAASAASSCKKDPSAGWYCGYYKGTNALLAEGSKGVAVFEVQALIANTTAYYAYHDTELAVDGAFGPRTRAAVRWFQATYMGSAHVDGIVGPNTWKRLRQT
ncbi:peptidoglycan-binding protein [Streptomyces sp. PTY087I2]|uniref:peptidoglycan-binding domain-containing protein n=1 Tax=Streptomyces sp. PTY087I2 TaxID=1819298 RepID=UPI00080B0B75|nr:peptidoglycan-binding protein [Streptomyces sp. PTY087I2]OCC10050.1 Zinc D-Ala-D-Ala carboxypeptidase precursor [Streptomyces sp. PTY087I2]